jgi:predicted transcriptional regulator YheO
MAHKEEERMFELLGRLTKTLGELLGPSTEVVLHDLREPEHSIIAIANQQLTGRKVGDTIESLGVHLFASNNFQDMANYETRTKTGKVLRSCSVFVRDGEGRAIGALCVNRDTSALLKLRDWLEGELLHSAPAPEPRTTDNVEDVLEHMIEGAIRATGKSPNEFSRDDKIAVISYLDARGAFLIRYSMEKVATLLCISKFSIYNYLNDMRAETISLEPAKAQVG